MSRHSIGLPENVLDYLRSHNRGEHPVQKELRELTGGMSEAAMQISSEQGNFMQFLVGLAGVKRYLEVGVFTGYSSLSVALALPEDGSVHALDVSEEWTKIARSHWEAAGVSDKIQLILGPAIDSLDSLLRKGEEGTFDMAFIDADKVNYKYYYERCLSLLRPGGLILIDNVLWSGDVADPDNVEVDTMAIRVVNDYVLSDDRVDHCMVPVGDGITMVRKL